MVYQGRHAVARIQVFQEFLGPLILSPNAPVEWAEEFLERLYTRDGVTTLVYHRNVFYEWQGSNYKERNDEVIGAALYEFLGQAVTFHPRGHAPFQPTKNKVNEVIHALRAKLLLDRDRNPPFWLDQREEDAVHNLLACHNGLLNIDTQELLPHSPQFFNVNALPFDYDPNADAYPPEWMKFLRQLWPGNDDGKQARCTLQDIFGVALTNITSFQKIFMIVGPPRSGKGTIGRMLTAILGKDNVVNPTLGGMTGEFGLWPLIDKRLAIISDARLGKRTDANTIAERMLSISGEDGQNINRKFMQQWSGNLGVRFLIMTNELPRITDASGALASRFVVLTLTELFLGREDLTLSDRLGRELTGILNWALRGLKRLRRRGYFVMPKSSEEAIARLVDQPWSGTFEPPQSGPQTTVRTSPEGYDTQPSIHVIKVGVTTITRTGT